MATLRSFEDREMPFLKAVARAKTGDMIRISDAPNKLNSGYFFAHMLGLLSVVNDRVYLNDKEICRNDVKETHSNEFYPFCENVLFCRKEIEGGTVVYKFYRIVPLDSLTQEIGNLPKPAFKLEAEDLEIRPMSSGRGLILIESKPKRRILLLHRFKIFGTTWNKITAKKIMVAWEGDHATYADAPHSIVVGTSVPSPSGVPTTRFYRGQVGSQTVVHNQVGTKTPTYWATDTDFFYSNEVEGQDVIISAGTGKPIYVGVNRVDLFTTSGALVWCKERTVKANGRVVTDSFVADWFIQHAFGLIFGLSDEIRMLVIKEKSTENKK